MATQPRLVNKQFNSPIGLYSENNIKEVLKREQQILANGAIGIDFQNTNVGKPSNLQSSAVLRMLEEEEHRRHGTAVGVKRVAWPPSEGDLDSPFVEQNAVTAQGGPQYPTNQQPQYRQAQAPQHPQSPISTGQRPVAAQQSSYRPLKPLDVTSVSSSSPLASPIVNQVPTGYRPATPSKQWGPVHSPVSTPGVQQYQPPQYQQQPQYQQHTQYQQPPQYQQQPQYQTNQYQQAQQAPHYQQAQPQPPAPYHQSQYQETPQQYQAQFQINQSAQKPQSQPRVQQGSAKYAEPPPTTITLRQQAPVSQAPPPIITSQPATATLKGQVTVGGKHLRGDLKWPPENVRQRMAEERMLLEDLAKGPAVKPLRQDKDYTPFFEAHALNSAYPGYKIPPGTQFYRPM